MDNKSLNKKNNQKKQKYLKIFGKNYKTIDGTGARDYIHIDDLAETHLKSINLLLKRKNINEILNIGCGSPITVKSVLNSFKKYFNYSSFKADKIIFSITLYPSRFGCTKSSAEVYSGTLSPPFSSTIEEK